MEILFIVIGEFWVFPRIALIPSEIVHFLSPSLGPGACVLQVAVGWGLEKTEELRRGL